MTPGSPTASFEKGLASVRRRALLLVAGAFLCARPALAAGGDEKEDLWRVTATVSVTSSRSGYSSTTGTREIAPDHLVRDGSVVVTREGFVEHTRSGRAFISALLSNEGGEGTLVFSEARPLFFSTGGSFTERLAQKDIETVNGAANGEVAESRLRLRLGDGYLEFEDSPESGVVIAAGASGRGRRSTTRRRAAQGEWRTLESPPEEVSDGVDASCGPDDPGLKVTRSRGVVTVSCVGRETRTEMSLIYGRVTVVEEKIITATVRAAGRLEADAGGPYAPLRGEGVTLDGTGSSGAVLDYEWTFAPGAGCPEGTTFGSTSGKGPVLDGVVFLCPAEVTLRVSDGKASESDAVTVEVKPRDWRTQFEHVPEEGRLEPSLPPVWSPRLAAFAGGANACSLEAPHGGEGHILHPPGGAGGWEGAGYSLARVEDPGGPFDGVWYPSGYLMRVSRRSLVNAYVVPGGPPPLAGLGSFYERNAALGADVAAYLAAVRGHERERSRLLGDWLADNDPARRLEGEFHADRDGLKGRLDSLLRLAETAACRAAADPLPGTWEGSLFFARDDAGVWTEGLTRVGGEGYGDRRVCE